MEIPSFFERDRDEIVFRGVTYLDYFNLYPNLPFEPTLRYLTVLENIVVIASDEDSEGWRIAVRFCGVDFLLDSHYHGTSTLFCAEKSMSEINSMLAFLGCFAPLIRDEWKYPTLVDKKKTNWFRRLLGRDV